MNIFTVVRVLLDNVMLIVTAVLLGIAAGSVMTVMATPQFLSTAKIFVSVQSPDAASATDLSSGNSYAQQKIKSYVELVTNQTVLQPVVDELHLDVGAGGLAKQITTSFATDTVLIEIAATDPDPQRAANIANATAASLERVVLDGLEKPSDGSASLINLQTFETATPAAQPYSPNLAIDVGWGALLGLVLGCLTAGLRHVANNRVMGRPDVEAVSTEAPVLGGILFDPRASSQPLIVQTDPRSSRAEAFRALRTNLRFVGLGHKQRAFVITSSVPGEGKSTTTVNLALALAEAGSRTIIVDADMRIPRIAEYLQIEGSVGLSNVLVGEVALEDVVQKWGERELYVLPAGSVPPNPSMLIDTPAFADLIRTLGEQFDYVLVDAPPVLAVTDSAIMSHYTAGVIMVVAVGQAKKSELAAAVRGLERTGVRVAGFVLTMISPRGADAYGSAAYGYYGTVTEGATAPVTSPRPASSR